MTGVLQPPGDAAVLSGRADQVADGRALGAGDRPLIAASVRARAARGGFAPDERREGGQDPERCCREPVPRTHDEVLSR